MRRSTFFYLLKQGIREIGSLWKQFLAIVAIGAIAVTLFVGLQANADGLQSRVNAMYEAGNLADAYVTVNPIKGNQGDASEIKGIVGDDGTVESRFYSFAKINTTNAYCAISQQLPTISKPSEMKANKEQTETDFLIVDKILVDEREVTTADSSSRLRIGEKATIEFDFSAYVEGGILEGDYSDIFDFVPHLKEGVSMDDTPIKNLKFTLEIPVTGSMSHPENVLKASYSVSIFLLSSSMFARAFDEYLATFFDAEGVDLFYSALSFSPLGWDRERPSRFPVADQFLAKLNKGADEERILSEIEDYFDAKDEDSKNLISLQKNEDMSFALVMETDVTQARQLTYVFPFVFFAVAILVILTTMSQLILKERTQIGTLKAMGFSTSRIQRYYAAITLGVTGLGTLIGEILGPLIIPGILNHKYTILYNLPKGSYVFPVLAGVLTAVIFLSLSALVSFLTCRKEASLLPAESMRPALKNYGKKTRNSHKKGRNCTVFSLLMALRNIFHNKVKSTMVVLGIMGCTALLCCGFGIDDTIQKGLDIDPYISNNSDITLTLTNEVKTSLVEEDLNRLLPGEIDGIQGYSRSNTEIRFKEKSVSSFYQIISPFEEVNEGSIDPHNFPFSWQEDKVLVTKKIADKLSLSKGDKVSFKIGNREITAEVFAIEDLFYSNGVFIYSDSPLFEDKPIGSFSSYYLNVKDKGRVDDIKGLLSKELAYVGSADTNQDWRIKLNDIISSVAAMTTAVKVFAILLAIVVLYNLSLLNFKERTRDIATMKVLGFARREIALSLLFETMVLTFVGVLFGLALGFPFLYLVLYINQVEIISYPYCVAILSYFLAFALTFGVASLINLYLATRTNQVKMVESLKSVE